MSGRRSPRYPMLKAYLIARPRPSILTTRSAADWGAGFGAFAGLGIAGAIVGWWWCGAPLLGLSGWIAYRWYRESRAKALPTPEQLLAREADAVVRGIGDRLDLNPEHRFRRLHRVFHPAVAAILEECAGYHARVASALDAGDWSYRNDLREGARTAANVAMDEAIVLAGKTLAFAPEPRPLDALSDTLEEIGFGPLARNDVPEPMPVAFRPAREIAERLRELAVRCETAAQQHREESPEPVSAAFRHLDATLGEMRRLEEAEGELRQGA